MSINIESSVNRHNMYLKYKESKLFTYENKGKINTITPKVTEKANYSSVYHPLYNEKSAREQYMKQLWNKEIKDPKKPKPIKLNLNLNANDIVCRDMFSECDAKEYRIRRSKSFFLPRSSYNLDLQDKNTMSSRRRKIDHMSSDIFFTECNTPRKSEKERYLAQLTATPKDKFQAPMSFRNRVLNYSATKTNGYSRLPSSCGSRNTEPSLRRSITIGPKRRSFFKSHLCERDTNTQLSEVRDSIASSGCKTNPTNVESVKYNILQPSKPNNSTTPSLYKFNPMFKEEKKKVMNPAKLIENYEINVPKEFTKVNVREIKNYFLSEGLHIFSFQEKQNCTGENGKLTFKIRRSDIDKDYDNKISKINKKVEKHQMVMKQVPFLGKLPIATISIGLDSSEYRSDSFRTQITQDKTKPNGVLSKRSMQNSPSKTKQCFEAIKQTSFKSEKQQYDMKYKNKHTSKKA